MAAQVAIVREDDHTRKLRDSRAAAAAAAAKLEVPPPHLIRCALAADVRHCYSISAPPDTFSVLDPMGGGQQFAQSRLFSPHSIQKPCSSCSSMFACAAGAAVSGGRHGEPAGGGAGRGVRPEGAAGGG